MNEEQALIVVELAKEFIGLVRSIEPKWNRAFFRFSTDEMKYGSNASYSFDSAVTLIDPFKCKPFFSSMNEKGKQLFRLIKKERGVLLLTVDSDFNYDTKFEYDNLERWKISKIDGGTGVPVGI